MPHSHIFASIRVCPFWPVINLISFPLCMLLSLPHLVQAGNPVRLLRFARNDSKKGPQWQLVAISLQLSAFSYQLSAISYQLSAISSQRLAADCWLLTASHARTKIPRPKYQHQNAKVKKQKYNAKCKNTSSSNFNFWFLTYFLPCHFTLLTFEFCFFKWSNPPYGGVEPPFLKGDLEGFLYAAYWPLTAECSFTLFSISYLVLRIFTSKFL